MKKLSFSLLLLALTVTSASFLFAASAPAVGAMAPNFNLTSQEGTPISLDQFRGKWVVLYFYPKDMTTGCTIEAHNFQRDQEKFQAKNAVILGVSVQDTKSHQDFCAKEGLTFKLLSDVDDKVSDEYGSIMTYGGAKYSARHTFLIDPQGKIAKEYMDVDPKTHSEQLLADLTALENQSTKGGM